MIERFLRRLTVRQRIFGGFASLVLLLLLSIPLIVANHVFLVGRLQEVTEVETRADRLLLRASTRLASSRVNLMRYADYYTPSPGEALNDIAQATQLLNEARELVPSSDQKDAVDAVLGILLDYRRLIDEVQTARAEVGGQRVPQLLFQTYRLGTEVEQKIADIVQASETQLDEANEEVYSTAQGRLLFLVLGYAGLLIVSLFFAVQVARSITRPVGFLRNWAEAFSQGQLEGTIPVVGSDELSMLSETFNRMAENLRESQQRQAAWSQELEEQVATRTQELRQAFDEQEQLLRTIREMSSPVIPVMEGILVTPIVGTLDSERAQRVVSDILAGIEHHRARVIILDITALAVMDTAVANVLLQAARSAKLLGTEAILVGIAPEVAETLVQLGIELQDLHTAATLQEGLRLALGLLRRRIVSR